MSQIFKNCSLVEVIYLLIRFKKTVSAKNTDENGENEQNTHTCITHTHTHTSHIKHTHMHHTEREIELEKRSVGVLF